MTQEEMNIKADKILSDAASELADLNFKLVCLIKEEEYESASVYRDKINLKIIKTANQILDICKLDILDELKYENELIRKYVEDNFLAICLKKAEN